MQKVWRALAACAWIAGSAVGLRAQALPLSIVDAAAQVAVRTWPVSQQQAGIDLDFSVEGAFSATTDVLHELAFCIREAGDPANSLVDAGGASGFLITPISPAVVEFSWTSLAGRGLGARLRLSVQSTSLASGRLLLDWRIDNPGATARTVTTICYVDIDNHDSFGNVIDARSNAGRQIITRPAVTDHFTELFGDAPSHWETDRFGGNLLGRILDPTRRYDLANAHSAGLGGLDVTGAVQWRDRVIPAGGQWSTTIVIGHNDAHCGPSGALASVSSYGVAAADALGRRPMLANVRGPVAGAELELVASYVPHGSAALLLGGATSIPFCGLELLVTGGATIPLPLDVTGAARIVMPPSPDPLFCGIVANFQLLCLTTVGGPCPQLPIVHSAGLRWTFGD